MSKDNVTQISQNRVVIHESLKKAIDEQQTAVWRLRNLIEAVNRASEGGEVEDIEAALSGAVDYADWIHMALDFDALVKRAKDIEDESRRAHRTEEES